MIPVVTEVDPPPTLRSSINIPASELADPDFCQPGPIDLLLCAEYYLHIFIDEYIPGNENHPPMSNTVFGWIIAIAGCTKNGNPNTISVHRCGGIAHALEQFWSCEEVQAPIMRNTDEEFCENFYISTVSRDNSGRYTVRLLLKDSANKHCDSRVTAVKILLGMPKRLSESQMQSCTEFMNEYMALDHMTAAPMLKDMTQPHYYLPYHPVFKESSVITKTRIVFNGSKPTSTGVSLNDILHTGPVLQEEMIRILIRFRSYLVAFCSDAATMYRQVLLHPLDRNFQRIVWFDKNGKIQDHILNTVTYGLGPSAFLVIRTLFQVAKDEKKKYLRAAAKIISDIYVDDVFNGVDNETEAKLLVEELDLLTKSGGFMLRKWASNKPSVLQAVAHDERDIEFRLNDSEIIGALGLTLCPRTDEFNSSLLENYNQTRNLEFWLQLG